VKFSSAYETHLNGFVSEILPSFFFTSSAICCGSDRRRWKRHPVVNAISLYVPRESSQLKAYFYTSVTISRCITPLQYLQYFKYNILVVVLACKVLYGAVLQYAGTWDYTLSSCIRSTHTPILMTWETIKWFTACHILIQSRHDALCVSCHNVTDKKFVITNGTVESFLTKSCANITDADRFYCIGEVNSDEHGFAWWR